MSVQSMNDGCNPVKLGVKLPEGGVKILTPFSRKAMKAEADALAKRHNLNAKELREKLFAVIKEKGMEFPSDHNAQQTVKAKADRKRSSRQAMDVALHVCAIAGNKDVDMVTYNVILADLLEGVGQGTPATAAVMKSAPVDFQLLSWDYQEFQEVIEHGGRYTKALVASRQQRLKLAKDRKDAKARRARKAKRVNRRLKSYLERLSRGLIQAKPRTQSRALSMSTMCTYYRRARRMASKAYKVVMAKVDDMLDHCEMPAKAVRSTQYLVGFDWVGFKVSIDRFEDLLSSLLVRYFKERKEALKPLPDTEASDRRKRRKRIPVIQEQCTIQAQLAWGKGYWNRVTQKLSINLGSLVAKACK